MDYHLVCLQGDVMECVSRRDFLEFVVKFDYREVVDALLEKGVVFPPSALFVAIRYRRNHMFHRLLAQHLLKFHRFRSDDGENLLLSACRWNSDAILRVLFRYVALSRLAVDTHGHGCVYYLVRNRLYHHLHHFYDRKFASLWSAPYDAERSVVEETVARGYRVIVRDLRACGIIE